MAAAAISLASLLLLSQFDALFLLFVQLMELEAVMRTRGWV